MASTNREKPTEITVAYVSKEKKAKIAAALKLVVPKTWKYTLSVRNHSTITMTIKSAPIDLTDGGKRSSINHYWLADSFSGKTLATLEKIKAALNTDNYDRSDIQTDYFDVGHYVNIALGRWDKPFEVK